MTKRKVVWPVRKKYDRLKYYLLSLLQALLGVIVVVCIFIYRNSTLLEGGTPFESDTFVPGFSELRGNYFESPIFNNSYNNAINDIVRYSVLREQLETDGEYDPKKIIYIGSYAHRKSDDLYEGPDAAYYLDDLLKWGRAAVSHEAQIFFSWEEYYSFWGIETSTDTNEDAGIEISRVNGESVLEIPGVNSDNDSDRRVIAYLDTIINKYRTVDGLKLEEVVNNSEDYNNLSFALEQTVSELKQNYEEYLKLKEYYDSDATNVYYCAVLPYSNTRHIYSNDGEISKAASEKYINDRMRNYGYYTRFTPGEFGFTTNTKIASEEVESALSSYLYIFPKNSVIWISVDSALKNDDLFRVNYNAFYRGSRVIPWIISLGILAVTGFFAIMVYLIFLQKKRYSFPGAKDYLNDFDKLPFEISFLFFVILITILIVGESIILRSYSSTALDELSYNIIPVSSLMGIDLFIILVFFYGFVRRVICKNLFEGSLVSSLFPLFAKVNDRLKEISQSIYDDSGLIIKVWVGYILFLTVNLFLFLFIFSSGSIVAAVILVLFDIVVGFEIYKRNVESRKIIDGIKTINSGEYDFKFDSDSMHGINRSLAKEINNTGQSISKAVETSIKDEKLKADLITNVSHDIKTPLTSIINYVDLLKKEKIDNKNAEKYLKIIDEKAERLRQLTFDLVEASKISSGNIVLEIVKIDFVELLGQTIGEFEDKFKERGLTVVTNTPDSPVLVDVDPRRIFRVIENLFNNIYKYALENTRVYLDLVLDEVNNVEMMHLLIKNVSKNELNIPADELTERFIRGDVSRNTEGSGLGLSIAKSLTQVQGGEFRIYLDGDLFKVTISFPVSREENNE